MAGTKTDLSLVEPDAYAQELAALDRLLRGELSAVETYDQCIEHVDSTYHPELQRLRDSHQLRSEQIYNHIALLGGDPSEGAGAWSMFTRAVEAGGSLLGDRAALEALEVGELRGVREYQDVSSLEPETRAFVRSHLRPEQERTYAKLGALIREAS